MAPAILLADDSPTIRGFVRLVLRALGQPYELIEVEDGAQALDRARSAPPALALIDLHMPGNDGIEVLRGLRGAADARLRALPILLLTAERDEDRRRACVEAGASGFLDKPLKPAALLEAVRKQLDSLGASVAP